MKKILNRLVLVTMHIIACVIVIAAFWPMAKWYFDNPTLPESKLHTESKVLWGVDFQYTATLTNLLRNNITLPPAGWGYSWFTGWPLLSNYPILHYYLILPFTIFFDLITAVKLWMLVSFGLFFAGLYATFYLLSRNVVFACILAVASIYSVGVYGPLMWGGSLPSHATQAFLPWVVFFIMLYLKKQSIQYLLVASLLTGFAIWGHPQIVIAYIYPFAAILLVFSFWGIPFLSRVKALSFFVGISFLVGLPLLYTTMGDALKVLVVTDSVEVASSTARTPSATTEAVAAFHKAQPYRIYIDTNTTIFILLAAAAIFFLIMFAFNKRKERLFFVLPFIVLSIFETFYVWIFSFGISIYHGGWYRLFWATPFWIGILAASLWGSAQTSIQRVAGRLFMPILFLASAGILVTGLFLAFSFSKDIKERIIPRSNPSSAFPDVLNLRTDPAGRDSLKNELVPSWLPADEVNVRLYNADQTVNLWWNSLYKMPLARGYFDPPVSAKNRGYFFWLDAALSQDRETGEDQLVGVFKSPEKIALNNTLFLIDWYAIKYFEAGHAGPTTYAPLPNSLTTEQFIEKEEVLDFNKQRYNKGNQTLHYYSLKDEFVSPILSATNAKTIGIIATDGGYETIIRGIGDMNLSSQILIPIKLGNKIDAISAHDLSAMDALILYDYTYGKKDRAFRLISEYVKTGRHVLIDTGVEVKESASSQLPEIFPFEQSTRKSMGLTWNFDVIDERFSADIDFLAFDPPLFDKYEWKISFPKDSDDLRQGAQVILRNHDVPVLASYAIGKGEVVWSGLNLPYHVIRSHNEQEVLFFRHILMSLFTTIPKTESIPAHVAFVNPQRRTITVDSVAHGVLFKEQAYPGWQAMATSGRNSRALKVFKAGPAYPGFMYIRLPLEFQQKSTVITFTYKGSITSWALSLIAFFTCLIILEEVLLRGKVVGRVYRFVWRKTYGYVGTWWKRDDE